VLAASCLALAGAFNVWLERGPSCASLECAEDGVLGCQYEIKRDMIDLHDRGILADMQVLCDGRYLCETCDGEAWGPNDTFARNDTAARLLPSECTDWVLFAAFRLVRDCTLPAPSHSEDSRAYFLDINTARPAAVKMWVLQIGWLLVCTTITRLRDTFEFVLMGRGRTIGCAWVLSHFTAVALVTAVLVVPDDA